MGIIPGPSVAPQYYGGDVGGKIADALSTYYQLNRQKQLDALQYGIGLKWPGAGDDTQGSAPSGPSIGVGDRIRSALSHVGIGSNPIPAEQAQWKVNQGAPSVGITPNAAEGGTVVAPAPEAGPSHDAISSMGGLPDYMTLPNGQRIPTIMTPFGSRILAAMKTRAEIGVQGSEADRNAADADYTRHKNRQPLPGDPGYVQTMAPVWGGEAGAKAAATLPFDLQKLVTSGQISLRNALAEVQARGGVEAGLQANQQQFTSSQNALNRTQQTTLQSNAQSFERGMVLPKAQAGAQAAQSTEQYKEGGQIIPSIVRPINNGLRSLMGASPLGASRPSAVGPLPSAKPTISATERGALIKQGFAPADVDAKYSTQGGGSSF